VRFRFIQQHAGEFRVTLMCKVLGVSRAGYYAWLKRKPSGRELANQVLRRLIRLRHQEHRSVYGYRRIHALLRRGQVVGKNRVARLMRQEGLAGRRRRRFKRTTQSRHNLPVAPNLLAQDFTSTRPNQKWVGDITYIPTDEGWLYLAVMLDLFSRLAVGWSMAAYLDDRLTRRALKMALASRRLEDDLLHHSDRGGQYASGAYVRLLTNQVTRSMNRTGNVYDNSPMESFFASLKKELVHERRFRTRREARSAIFDYIEVFYNRKRLHSSLGYLSPMQFETLSNRP
jgi:transposase InsO family protein